MSSVYYVLLTLYLTLIDYISAKFFGDEFDIADSSHIGSNSHNARISKNDALENV